MCCVVCHSSCKQRNVCSCKAALQINVERDNHSVQMMLATNPQVIGRHRETFIVYAVVRYGANSTWRMMVSALKQKTVGGNL